MPAQDLGHSLERPCDEYRGPDRIRSTSGIRNHLQKTHELARYVTRLTDLPNKHCGGHQLVREGESELVALWVVQNDDEADDQVCNIPHDQVSDKTHDQVGDEAHDITLELPGVSGGTTNTSHMSDMSLGGRSVSKSVSALSVSSDVNDTDDTHSVAREQEYETQFLGFTPKSFSDGMYNAVLEYTWDCFRASQQFMKSEFPDVVTDTELQQASEVIIPRLSNTIAKAFDKLETYLFTNIFHIPENVLLPEDRPHAKYSYTEEEEKALDHDIKELQEKMVTAKYMNACLKQELRDMEVVEKEYKQFGDLLTSFHKTCDEAGVPDMRESMLFLRNKTDNLRRAMESLDPLGLSQTKRSAAEKESEKASKVLKLS
ncbi:MIS12 kinetochore complex component [Lamellibrachia satsuma]|nr:MIS12 kinetochore complex component [Lamellibrachia satsuma]